MPQMYSSNDSISYQVNDAINIRTTITVPANNSKVLVIPSTYSLSTHADSVNVSIKYKENNIYKDASLFACADINNNSTITIYNDSNNEHTFYLSIVG